MRPVIACVTVVVTMLFFITSPLPADDSAGTPAKHDSAQSDADRILAAHGIDATPQGIIGYLRPLSQKRLRKLIGQLGHREYEKRREAMQVLSALPAVPTDALEQALQSSDPEVRYRAEMVLRRNRLGRNTEVLHAALTKIRGNEYAKAVPLLLNLIPQLQRAKLLAAAADALRNTAAIKHVPLLKQSLREGRHTGLRITALQTLLRVGGDDVIPDLRALLEDENQRIRLAAATALLKFRQRDSLVTLAELLRSDDVEIRAEAAICLRAATEQRFGFLAADKSPARQRAADNWKTWIRENGRTAPLQAVDPNTLLTGPGMTIRAMLKRRLTGHGGTVYSVDFSPDGKQAASVSSDHTLKLWNTDNGNTLWSKKAHRSTVRSVAFSPDGEHLATASYDSTVKLWNAKTGRVIRTLSGHTASLWAVAFSPDGKRLASAGKDKTIRIWDVKTGESLRILRGHAHQIWCVSFSPDGKRLASSSSDKTIRLWNVKTGKLLKTMTGHTSSVRAVRFSPDGRTLASGSLDKSIRLWDVASGRERVQLKGHRLSIKSLAFARNGRFLVSAGNDKTVRLWDTSTGKALIKLTGPTSSIRDVALSNDDSLLASCGSDRKIHIWKLERTSPFVGPRNN